MQTLRHQVIQQFIFSHYFIIYNQLENRNTFCLPSTLVPALRIFRVQVFQELALWHSSFSCHLEGCHPILECWLRPQLLCSQSSSLPMCLRKQPRKAEVLGPLLPTCDTSIKITGSLFWPGSMPTVV